MTSKVPWGSCEFGLNEFVPAECMVMLCCGVHVCNIIVKYD